MEHEMKRLLILALLIALGFIAGRFTAAPPTFDARADTGAELAGAFEDFQRAQRDTLALMQSRTLFEDPQMQAEAYRGLLYTLVGSIKAAALMDHDNPRFMRAADWTSKAGLDNPDNNYFVALLRDDQEYLIRGQRGTTTNLVFQLVVGQPGVRGAGSSTNVSVLAAADMQIDSNGSFELLVSRDNPGDGRNWLPSAEGAETLLVRFTHNNWATEQVGSLTIERIGAEGEKAPPLSPEHMAEKLREVAVHMYDRTATWLAFADKAWLMMPRNGVSKARASAGGLVGQYSAYGSWELEDHQAIVLSAFPSDADYQGIELGNRWFVSLDYDNRTSSMTLDQAKAAPDGSYYFVISSRDPGIHNWLDTELHESGLIMMRWQGLSSPLPDDQQPEAKLINLDNLWQHLPEGTPRVTEQQRKAQIKRRNLAVQRRFNG
jgi:hypothetical protein